MPAHRSRKRFGQHFLHDRQVIERLLESIDPGPGQTLIEIGPGEGALTSRLMGQVDQLHVIEIDRDLAEGIRRLGGGKGLIVHCADALAFDFAGIDGREKRIVGNLPYNISTPLLFHLLDQSDTIRDMILMLQKEVVDRLVAAPDSKDYGRLSVMVQAACRVEKLFEVGPGSFSPPPRVESAVVRLIPDPTLSAGIRDRDLFARLVREAFNQRRKTLRNALKQYVDTDQFNALGIDPGLRPENLDVAQFITLANALAADGNCARL